MDTAAETFWEPEKRLTHECPVLPELDRPLPHAFIRVHQ